jgi:WD40 repeat protein
MPGPYVEPVQLQVVCSRLWERLPAGAEQITDEDVRSIGDVDRALRDYYAGKVAAVVAELTERSRTGAGAPLRVDERQVREWFDRRLITGDNLRGQVLKQEVHSEGLDNRAIDALVAAHLVRAENRGGRTWFELAHDRLIQPVREDNAEWFAANLSDLQVQADAWERGGRNAGFLLRGARLRAAERWARDHELRPVEQELLSASRRERRNRWIFRSLLVLLVGLSVLAALAGWRALVEARRSLSRQLAAQAISYLDDRPDLALLLGMESQQIDDNPQSRFSVMTGLEHDPRLTSFLREHAESVTDVVFSPDGKKLASASADGTVIVWNVLYGRPIGPPMIGHNGQVTSVAFRPDGTTLASGGADGQVLVWDVLTGTLRDAPLVGHTKEVRSVAFSPDGKTLASGGGDGLIILWDADSGERIGQLGSGTDDVHSVAFSPVPDQGLLASGGCIKRTLELCSQGAIRLWDVATGRPSGEPLVGHTDDVWSVAFSPDGTLVGSSSSDETVVLWSVQERRPFGQPLVGHTDAVTKLAFGPDGGTLITSGADRALRLWSVESGQQIDPQPFRGHAEPILSVAFSPDGLTLASAGADHTIILWKLGERLHRVGQAAATHTVPVRSVVVSPDGRTLASGGEDHKVVLWNTFTGQRVGPPLAGHADVVMSVAFSPDGKQVASGSADKKVILWDAGTGQRLRPPLSGHADAALSLAYSPDGRLLASGGGDADRAVRLWDVATGQPVGQPLLGHAAGVWSLAFSPDGQLLAAGSGDGQVAVWNVASGERLLGPVGGHTGRVSALAFGGGGSTLVSVGEDKRMSVWEVGSFRRTDRPLVDPPAEPLTAAAFGRDGSVLSTGHGKGSIVLWDVATGRPIGAPFADDSISSSVSGLSLSTDGRTLASAHLDGSVRRWSVATHRTTGGALNGHAKSVWSVAFSSDGEMLAYGSEASHDTETGAIGLYSVGEYRSVGTLKGHESWVTSLAYRPGTSTLASGSCGRWDAERCVEGEIRLWDQATRSGDVSRVLRGHTDWVQAVAYGPDGRRLASGSADGTVILWDTATEQPLGPESPTVPAQAMAVTTLAFSPDGQTLATGSDDRTVVLWSVTGDRLVRLGQLPEGDGGQIRALAFSPDGRRLATGSRNGRIWLWDAASRRQVGQPLTGHAGAVLSVAFSPDGSLLASGSQDTTIRLWDVASGQPVGRPLAGHTGRVTAVAFGRDHTGTLRLASGGDDGWVMLWGVSFNAWQARACQIVDRNLTEDERQTYLTNQWYLPSEWHLPNRSHLPGESHRPICPESVAREADSYALRGQDQEARAALGEAVTLAVKMDAIELNSDVCWYGAVSDVPATVLAACDRSIELALTGSKGWYRDSRGMVRARLGRRAEAIEDFRAFVEWCDDRPEMAAVRAKRERWIAALEAGENLFPDRAAVLALRREWSE